MRLFQTKTDPNVDECADNKRDSPRVVADVHQVDGAEQAAGANHQLGVEPACAFVVGFG